MKQSEIRTTSRFGRLAEGPVYRFSKWVSWISLIVIVVIMALITVDVLMRRFLRMPIPGNMEIVTFLEVVLIFCAVAYVMTVKGHIIANVFTRLYPQRLHQVTTTIGLFLSLILVAAYTWGSIVYALDELSIGEISIVLKIPVAPFIFVAAFGSAVLFLVILVQLIRNFVKKD